mmetsp:Transcript_22483/g.33891  ORF Transcript_22483/g.33891 Transcript_22483/m.33891 type:complete len:189 (-) Transcript_22483:225-791(-)
MTEENGRCQRMKDFALQFCPKAVFMLEHIDKLGCAVPQDFWVCKPCGQNTHKIAGGFMNAENNTETETPQVVLCEDAIFDQNHLSETMVHELVHAYDSCRADLSLSNLYQHACTEVRASNLSGECSWKNEICRGNFGIKAQQKECVRRRAVLSLIGNPYCANSKQAEKVVEDVLERCLQDTAPFDRNP